MKKIQKFVCFIIILSCLYSCNPEPIENYRGGIICEKKQNRFEYYQFKIKYINNQHKYAYKRVYVLDFDYNKYNLGDTIK